MVRQVKQYTSKTRRSSLRKRNYQSFWHRMLVLFLLVCASALIMSYFSVLISPKILWIPFFFGLYYIPLVLINIALLLIEIFKRNTLLLIPLIALLPSFFFSDKYIRIGEEQQVLSEDHIKIMTYNLGRFKAGESKVMKLDVRRMIADYIKEENPDIICLQEYAIDDTSKVAALLPQYPYRFYHLFRGSSSYFGNVTLSRYPIIDKEKILFSTSCNLCIVSDIEVGEKILRVFNCHLESYGISFTSIIKKLSDKNVFADEIIQLHEHIRSASLRRTEQVDQLAERSAGSPYPLIICGDFNDTPISYVYNKLSEGKKDGFEESGAGFGSTYSTLWPLLRIDYILIPEEFLSGNYEVARIPYSDHYPVNTSIYFQ